MDRPGKKGPYRSRYEVLTQGNKLVTTCHMANIPFSGSMPPVWPEITDAETTAMLRAFFNLAEHWQLSDRQGRILVGDPAARTYARWKTGQVEPSRISRDTR